MLRADLLKANEPLKELTDEQINIIVALSKRDEEQVIAKRIGELHSDYDKDILEATGIEKRAGEKTYAYLKRAVPEKLEAYKGLESEIEGLRKEKEELLKGGDSKQAKELQKQLDEKIKKIELLKDQHSEALKLKDQEIESQLKSMDDFKVDSIFQTSIAGLQFNDTIPEVARKALIDDVQSHVKSLSRDWIDGKLVFKDESGEILRDKTTLEPLGVDSIASTKLEAILKGDRPAGGAGSKGGKPAGTTSLTGFKNKVELTKAIGEHLLAQGVARGTAEWQEQEGALYAEHSKEL